MQTMGTRLAEPIDGRIGIAIAYFRTDVRNNIGQSSEEFIT